jgi:hypothetical protein
MQESALNLSKGHSPEVRNEASRATLLSPDQAKKLLLQRAYIMIPRSSACSDKSKNFGGSKTHRAAGSKMLHGG